MNNTLFSDLFKISLTDVSLRVFTDKTFCGFAEQSAPQNTELHYHTNYEIFFVGDDVMRIYTPNGDFTFKNCVVCVPPFLYHYSRFLPTTCRLFFKFPENTEGKAAQICAAIEAELSQNIKILRYTDFVFTCLDEIKKEMSDGMIFHSKKTDCLLTLIFTELFRENGFETANGAEVINNDYSAIIDYYVFSMYDKNPTLSDLADAMHLSKRQASRIVMQTHRRSFSSMILDKKLTVACSLLTTTDLSINEIIQFVNFNTESYFFNVFKKKFGCSPLEYRKKNSTFKDENQK